MLQELELYQRMLLIRYAEETIDWLFKKGMMDGTCHLCIGQEAVAVGVLSKSNSEDIVVSNHRGHGHLLGKGGDVKKLFLELMGKKGGYCDGRGGSQHICAKKIGFYGTNGITGGGIPISVGIALAKKFKRENGIVFCFFGDGATNQGTFHESLNMASLWKLPVLFCCENNGYAMSMPTSRTIATNDLKVRPLAYGIPIIEVDGMDIIAVVDATEKANQYIRSGQGPFFLLAKTYRFCGHSKSDMRIYRTKEEEAKWKLRDPIIMLEKRLLEENLVNQEVLEKLKKQIKEHVQNVLDESLSAPKENDTGPFTKIFYEETIET